MTCPIVTVCVLLKVLIIALVKSYIGACLLLQGHTPPTPVPFMTALLESLALMATPNIISVLILTILHFSRVRKSILDT